ncbi:MAG: trimeric intracellular cation channel family protein [Cyanobacteria bacterium J06626_14]
MHQFIELSAVVASAVYGVLLARRHNLDFVGVFTLAFIVAFGGGTLRDLFLDRHPLFWIRENHYPVIVFVIALATSIVPRIPKRTESFLRIPDAFGLGLFTVSGTSAAIDAGTSLFIASLLGAVTGTFGSVIGDVICNRVPSLFRPAPLFATCSFVGAWVYILFYSIPVIRTSAAPISILFIVIFRLVAIRYKWILPHFGDEPPGDEANRTVI